MSPEAASPIHYEGMGGNGKRIRFQALIDPQTGSGVRDWSRACELVRDMEAPTPLIAPITRTTIADAIEHFLKLKTGKAPDTYHKSERAPRQAPHVHGRLARRLSIHH